MPTQSLTEGGPMPRTVRDLEREIEAQLDAAVAEKSSENAVAGPDATARRARGKGTGKRGSACCACGCRRRIADPCPATRRVTVDERRPQGRGVHAPARRRRARRSVRSHLQEDEIEQIAREVAVLGSVPRGVRRTGLEEFHQTCGSPRSTSARGGVDYAQKLLGEVARSRDGRASARSPREVVRVDARCSQPLEKADPQQLSKFILGEHPQTIALILAHLQPGAAPRSSSRCCLMTLRVDVLTRMASLEEISPEVIARISSVIEQRLKSLGGGTREQHGGVRAVAELFNRLDRSLSQSGPRSDRDASRRTSRSRSAI